MKKMLIMDDEIGVCEYVKSFFEERGFRVFTSTTVNDAITLVKKEKPHVIILDIKMDKRDSKNREGIAALPEVRKICPKSKIIMITGVENGDVAKETKKLGAYRYITKPLKLDELVTIAKE